jgi:hypothetical protein
MYRIYFVSLLVLGLVRCTDKKPTVDNGLESFTVEGSDSGYDLRFTFPSNFVSVLDMDEENQIDTTDIALNWILEMQYDNPKLYCLYDSMETKKSIFIQAGKRLDISDKERDFTYFSVPTVPLSMIFPAIDSAEIIFDSGKKKYKDKTYYKRTYQSTAKHRAISDYYYISTTLQSVLVIVNSPTEIDMDKYVLSYEVQPRAN